jgi:uncharacterized protein
MKQIMMTLLAAITFLAATAQEPIKQKTITVTGTAESEIVPDEIYVQVTLKEYDKKNSTKVDIDKIKNDFLNACKAIGLTEKDISVQSYSGYDGNAWITKKNKKKDPDLKASITYSIKLSTTAKMDELVEKMDDEATQSFNISRVSHSKLTEYKKQLKIEAIKAAKEKAVYLAGAIDEQVAGALTINDMNEGSDVVYPQARMYANVAMADAAAPMNVDFKKIKLQFSVMVTFLLK